MRVIEAVQIQREIITEVDPEPRRDLVLHLIRSMPREGRGPQADCSSNFLPDARSCSICTWTGLTLEQRLPTLPQRYASFLWQSRLGGQVDV